MRLNYLILISMLFIALIDFSRSEHCNEDHLKKCLKSLESLLEKQFTMKTETDINSYCAQVSEEGKCLQEATDACKEEHPLISLTTSRLFNYMNLVCRPGTDERTYFANITPCFETQKLEFKKCLQYDDVKDDDDVNLENSCKDMKNVFCVADVSRKVCGKAGESFADNMEYGLKGTYEDVCNGSFSTISQFWLLMLATMVVMFIQNSSIKNNTHL